MRTNERKLQTLLFDQLNRKSTSEVVEYIWKSGLVNRKAVEKLYIANEVARRVRAGEGKCRAIEQVADEMCYSYEKVRGVIYAK